MVIRHQVLILLLMHIAACAQRLQQERVLVLTRHGIRVPFSPLPKLPTDVYSLDLSREWFSNFSDWGADEAAGLTEHGQNVLFEMGAHFREVLLNASSGGFTIYSDRSHRDVKTAISFFKGAMPNAHVTEDSLYGPGGATEQEYIKLLLQQGDSNNIPGCVSSGTLPDVIAGETGGDLAALSGEQRELIMSVNTQFDCCKPELCKHEGNSSFGDRCSLMSLPTEWEGQAKYWEVFTGPLTIAAKLMEYVQLLYLNGMPWKRLVPTMTEDMLASLMHLHEESMAIADDYWNSVNFGSELLVHLAATMQQVVGVEGQSIKGLQSTVGDSLVYYAAHDINIHFIRRLLRLNWLTTSYSPNASPPGGMLIFVLYSLPSSEQRSTEGSKAYFVKAFFMSTSMRQQREARKLSAVDPASLVFAVIPGCADGPELSCPFEDFKRLVLREIKQKCVKLVDPNVLSEEAPLCGHLADRENHNVLCGARNDWWWYCLVGTAAILIAAFLGALVMHRCGSRRRAVAHAQNIGTSLCVVA